MDKYCPQNIEDHVQSVEAAKKLFAVEWQGKKPNMGEFELELYQAAILVGHLRAWQKVVDTGTPAIIMEDDADILSDKMLRDELQEYRSKGANVVLLDPRHCRTIHGVSGHIPSYASGLTGYWIDVKAAKALLDNYDVHIPVDWSVNEVFNNDVSAWCPSNLPIIEYRGKYGMRDPRVSSAANGCKPGHPDSMAQLPHPVASILRQLAAA